MAQNPRNTPGEDANLVVWPLTISTDAASKEANAETGAPLCLRQLWQ
ncbi:MAG: hypothetical protein Q8K85_14100 [Hyphomicrobium sp.]|nr:hypothetical protein [Hyphomicrobium sp.]